MDALATQTLSEPRPAVSEAAYDPASALLAAAGDRPAGWGEVNLRTLTPFQRALLVTDGNVTRFIEAYTMEPIEIVRLSQQRLRLPAEHAWLAAPEGTEVVAREVFLRGRYSGKLFVYAVSLVVPARLAEAERSALEVDGEGLGRILVSSQRETRREVLAYGRERLPNLPDPVRELTGPEFISRVYRIIAGGQPLMLINEKFPAGKDLLPAHH